MNKLKACINLSLLIIFLLFTLLPIFWAISTSLKFEVEQLSYPVNLIPDHPTVLNYKVTLLEKPFGRYLFNSLLISLASMFVSLVMGSMCAYGLEKLSIGRGVSNQLAMWILSVRMIPPIVIIIPLYFMLNNARMLDTKLGIILVYLVLDIPFVVWMMKGFFREIPVGVEETSLVDGCTRWESFLRVTLPLASPGLVATAIFCLIMNWNEFLFALILSQTHKSMTLPVGIAGIITQYKTNWGVMAAASIYAITPVLLFAVLIRKYLTRGLLFGMATKK